MDQNGAQLFQPAAAVPQLPIHTTQREHRVPGPHILPLLRSQSQAVDPVRVFKEHRLPVPLRRQTPNEADVLPQIDDGPVRPVQDPVPGAGAGQPAFQQSGVARLLLKIAVQLHPALQQAGQVRADVGVLP